MVEKRRQSRRRSGNRSLHRVGSARLESGHKVDLSYARGWVEVKELQAFKN